jgi:hypothetical protein
MSGRRALAGVRAPDELGAEERAWAVVRSAYEERVPSAPHGRRARLALALALALSVGAIALSPAGATVGRLITRALGVEHASPALSSLPAPGRVLISGSGGTWTVAGDGATRLLGRWAQASWSPHGRYIAVASGNRLAALDRRGTAQWVLVRPAVGDVRWFPPSGYRVAYLSGDDLRAVAGDGTGDRLLAAGVARVAPAWRPGHAYQVAYLTKAWRLVVVDSDTGRVVWSAPGAVATHELVWSADGRRLLAISAGAVRVYTPAGVLVARIATPAAAPALDGDLSPDGHTLALVLGGGGGDVVLEDLAARAPVPHRVLAGVGLRQVLWSPDGRWLLVTWPAANQWVFVRVIGAPRIAAVSRIAQQFSAAGRHPGFPALDGWCCANAPRLG